jgi:hypothetical protein
MPSAAASTAVPEVSCQEHPGFKPVGTCSRCGRFVCARCETWGDFCAACEYRRLRELPSLARWAGWARGALALSALGALAGVVLNGWLSFRLQEGVAAFADASLYYRLSPALDVPVVVATGVSGLLFLRWLHLAVKTAKLLGLEPGTTPAWAVAWWFIPLANLYDPYLVVRDLWLSLGGSRRGLAAVSAWWTAWVLGGIAWFVKARVFWSLSSDPLQLTSAMLAGLVTGVLFTLGALLCIRVIAQIQAQIDECLDEVADAA